jgi:two-component system, cell cycle response regulator DivK
MSPRVLLVEDNDANADMLSRRLRRHGFVVLLAMDGLDAVAAATRERPDLVLMDIGLPKVDGLESTRRLKANPDTAAIPVVALTAHAMVSDHQKCLDAGCDGFETKPIDLPRLLDTIRRLIAAGVGA